MGNRALNLPQTVIIKLGIAVSDRRAARPFTVSKYCAADVVDYLLQNNDSDFLDTANMESLSILSEV